MRTCEKSTPTACKMSYQQHHWSLAVSGDDVLEEHDSKLNKSFVSQLTVCLYLLIYKTHYIRSLYSVGACDVVLHVTQPSDLSVVHNTRNNWQCQTTLAHY